MSLFFMLKKKRRWFLPTPKFIEPFIVSKISFLIPIALKNSCVKTTGELNVKNIRDKNIVILLNDYTYIVLGVRRERGRKTKRESENK